MKHSWQSLLRRLAAACVVSSSAAWSSAMCYAIQLAYDDATDPVYADGWQGTTTDNVTGEQSPPGDKGGFGFEPWNFDTDWLFNPDPIDGIQQIDDGLQSGGGNPNSSPFNNIGTAWRMANPEPVMGVTGLPRAGRGFDPLQVGQTIRVVFDNPTQRRFFGGYFIRFNTRGGEEGGGNICYEQEPGYDKTCSAADLNGDGHNVPLGATPEAKLVIQRFEYASFGQWGIVNNADADPLNEFHFIPLFDTDTAAAGAQIDLTITGPDTYQLTIDPFGPAAPHTETGMLLTAGEPIDWIEFTFFNTVTDPTFVNQTDLYISSIEIFDAAPAGVPGDYNGNGTVDAADYTVWRDHLGQQFQLDNEVTGVSPGQVMIDDYNEWKVRFGDTMGSSAAGFGSTAVPESSTFVCLVAAGAYLATWTAWRHR